MTHTEKFFKFPFKMYRNYDWKQYIHRQNKEIEDETGVVHDPPTYAIGYQAIDIDKIVGYCEAFSEGSQITDIQTNGGDCTLVELDNGKEIPCTWSVAEFEKNYNDFKEMLKNHYLELEKEQQKVREEEFLQETEKRTLVIKEMLEKHLSQLKEEYAKMNITLDLEQFEKSP